MRQASLKLKMSIQNVSFLNNNIEVEKTLLKTMLFILGSLAVVYLLILGSTVLNIIERRAMEKEALALSNEVGNFELSYLAISSSIDLALSSSMGFKETETTFVTRKSLGALSFNKNEI